MPRYWYKPHALGMVFNTTSHDTSTISPKIQPLNFRMLSHWGAHTCDKFPEGTMNGTTTHDKHHRGTCLAALVTLVGEVELPMIIMFCCQASTVAALVWQLWWSVVLSPLSQQ